MPLILEGGVVILPSLHIFTIFLCLPYLKNVLFHAHIFMSVFCAWYVILRFYQYWFLDLLIFAIPTCVTLRDGTKLLNIWISIWYLVKTKRLFWVFGVALQHVLLIFCFFGPCYFPIVACEWVIYNRCGHGCWKRPRIIIGSPTSLR